VGEHLMATQFCPECHQPLPQLEVVAGVRLTPLKASLLEFIKTHPGCTSIELGQRFYERKIRHPANSIRSHIYQINDALDGTGVRIRGDQFVGYHVVGSSI